MQVPHGAATARRDSIPAYSFQPWSHIEVSELLKRFFPSLKGPLVSSDAPTHHAELAKCSLRHSTRKYRAQSPQLKYYNNRFLSSDTQKHPQDPPLGITELKKHANN
ncbi:hypothetical protein E2C01_097304 [Portunus trituberculatus]|uniref:Uncharacterized protein n=1 Tax=Portunus trituberculatus TaxID=210409 RepID=A0A5B7JXY7_PORTR|nr:hypothetical protein [Portunus trituberculatus]